MKSLVLRLATAAGIALSLLTACTIQPPTAKYLAPDFQERQVRSIAVLPITYRIIVDTTHGRSPDQALQPVLLERLRARGYRAELVEGVPRGALPTAEQMQSADHTTLVELAPQQVDAVLLVDIDHYFVDLANPLLSADNAIDMNAEALLLHRQSGKPLWQAVGWAHFAGGRTFSAAGATGQLGLAFRVLADNLLRTLPPPP